ncbi:hypothetical protein [Coleofasciculus sp.]|uniref:hypothetical protein n=1 Tax=Coleofasciculus sp. TaxID=3100458 RepID=UPI003A2AE7A9
MKNLSIKLEKIAKEIDKHPYLKLIKFEYNEPLTRDDIRDFVEAEFEIELPAQFKEIFTQINGFRLEWEAIATPDGNYIDSALEVMGRIDIQDLYTIFEGPRGNEWKDIIWTDKMPSEEKEEMKGLKPFDFFDPDDGGYICLALDSTNNLANYMVLRSVDYNIRYLNIGIETYLDLLLHTRGYYRWQFFLNDPISDLYNFQVKLKQIKLFLPGYFPDANLAWINT